VRPPVTSTRPSHVAAVLQHVAADVVRPVEADVPALLPAAADQPEPPGHAGRQQGQAAQEGHDGKNQGQRKGRGKEEVVPGRVEGAVPAEEERVEGGHEQGAVT